jgi:hypothetical protein
MNPTWAKRNLLLKEFNIEGTTVLDIGCGDKSILQYLNFKSYLGIDQSDAADIVMDFNKESPNLTDKFEVGLVLGVLEYVDDPGQLIKSVKHNCDRMIILVLPKKVPKYHHGWQRTYNSKSFKEFLNRHFTNVTVHARGVYLIADVSAN